MLTRWLFFIAFIVIGVVLGLLFGWFVYPIEYVDAVAPSLGIDYKTDYVLMVAEDFQLHPDRDLAANRLALMGNRPTAEIIIQAVRFAEQIGYANNDLALMRALLGAFQESQPVLETPGS